MAREKKEAFAPPRWTQHTEQDLLAAKSALSGIQRSMLDPPRISRSMTAPGMLKLLAEPESMPILTPS